jgi:hypothetical protein
MLIFIKKLLVGSSKQLLVLSPHEPARDAIPKPPEGCSHCPALYDT